MTKLTLEEAKARLAELDKKARQLEEDIQKDGDSRDADVDLKSLS